MDSILKLKDTGQADKENKIWLHAVCKKTPKGRGQKKSESKQGEKRGKY